MLQQYRNLIFIAATALALLMASPSIQQVLVYPQPEGLTEFYLLDGNRNAIYPSNITVDETYRMYLQIANHLGSCAYYQVQIKFSNQTGLGPNSFNHTSSPLQPLGTLTVLVADGSVEEIPVEVSFQYNVSEPVARGEPSRLNVQNVTFNGFSLPANSSIEWDTPKAGYFGNLIFELWIYNSTTRAFQYHERYLSLWFNMMPES